MATGATMKWGGFDKALETLQDKLAGQKHLLMKACGQALVDGTVNRFEAQKDPQGNPWKPTARGGTILSDSGRLRDSISCKVAGDTVLVGTNVKYALIHQKGGVIKPKTKKALHFKTSGGDEVFVKSVTIPARPYLGVSKEDREEVEATIRDFIGGAFEE